MNKNYAEAIELLTNSRRPLNYEAIVIELAKRNPKLFIDIMSPERNTFKILRKENWMNTARSYLESGQKVEAIKTTRDALGIGLKEAKDLMEYVLYLINPGYSGGSATPPGWMTAEDHKMADLIAA